jgi:hypothetical protein
MPPVTPPPTVVALHAAPSIFADIDFAPLVVVLVGPVELLPPHAVEVNSAIASHEKRRRI